MDNQFMSGSINTVFGNNGLIWLVVACLACGNAGPAIAQTAETGTGTTPSPLALDLSSTSASIANTAAAPVALQIGGNADAGTISGGSSVTFSPGQMLTPAQYVALNQVLQGGSQTILLGAQGQASGGYANVTPSSGLNLSSLVVPQNVVLNSIGFTPTTPFSVTGDAFLSGALYALQTQPGLTAALNFGNLTISSGGLLSTVMPSTSTLAGVVSSANLNLNVAGTLANYGTIATGGALNLSAGNIINQTIGNSQALISAQLLNIVSGTGSIVNSGMMSAANSINIATANAAMDLNINSTGGVLEALNGAINIRDPLYALKQDTNITGGQFLAQELNLNGGDGTVEAHLEDTSAVVNVTAGNMHVGTNSNNLTLGAVNVSGDPIIYNTGGDVFLASAQTFTSADLILLAKGSIGVAGDIVLNSSAGSNSGRLFAVAGANFTVGAPATDTGVQQGPTVGSTIAGSVFTVTGSSGQPGSIFLTNVNTSGTTAGANGGDVTLVSFTDGVQVSSITTGGNGAGSNGKVEIFAPGSLGLSGIKITGSGGNAISTSGSTSGTATGSVILVAAPVTMAGGQVTFTAPATGDFWTVANSFAPNYSMLNPSPSITIQGDITTDGANIQAITGGNISVTSLNPIAISSQRVNGSSGNGGHIEFLAGANSLFSGGAFNADLKLVSPATSITSSGLGTGSGGNITLASGQGAAPLFLATTLTSSGGANGAAGNINIVAKGVDITVQGKITATSASSGGGNVYIAPSNWGFQTAANSLGNTIELNYNSGANGKIDVNDKIDTSGVNAGNITMFTFGGKITVSDGANIKALGNGGNNGSILMISPLGVTITTGAVDNSTGGTPGSGAVTIATAYPYLLPVGGLPIILDPSTGTVSKLPVFLGNNIFGLSASDISINGIKTNGAAITVMATGNVNLNSAPIDASAVGATASGGKIALIAGAVLGGFAGSGAVTDLGTITANGASTIGALAGKGGVITIASGGSLTIPNDINANAAVSGTTSDPGTGGVINIVSAGSITQTTGKLQAIGASQTGNGGKINLIAGNNFFFSSTTGQNALQINGASNGGGSITVGGAVVNVRPGTAGANAAGGMVFLTAFAGSTVGTGTVTISNGANFQVGGLGSGSDGRVLALVTGTGAGINVSNLSTNAGGGSVLGGGSILLATAAPFSATPSAPLIPLSTGELSVFSFPGSFFPFTPTFDPVRLSTGDISVTGLSTNGGSIGVIAGGNVDLNNTLISANFNSPVVGGKGGNIEIVAGARNSGAAGAGTISNLGTLSANGGASGASGGNGGNITVATGAAFTLNSLITANGSATGSPASGGNINIISALSLTQGTGVIQSEGFLGSGGNVLLSAGTNFNLLTDTPFTNPLNNVVRLTGASASGGNLTVGAAAINVTPQAPNSNGGNIRLAALVGSTAGTGTVNIANPANLLVGGSGIGSDGTITALGNGSVTVTGVLSTAAGGTGGGGGITLATNSAYASAIDINPLSGAVGFNPGAIGANSTVSAQGLTTKGGSISLAADTSVTVTGAISTAGMNAVTAGGAGGSGGQVQIQATGTISTGDITTIGGSGASNVGGAGGAGGAGAKILLNSVSSSLTVNGNLNSSGGGGGGGGTGNAGAGGAAGNIILSSSSLLSVTGIIFAGGGGGGGSTDVAAGTGNGGAGGAISAISSAGAISLGGMVNSSGGGGGGGGGGFGGGTAGAGGAAGTITLTANSTLTIVGPVLAAGGGGGGAPGGEGSGGGGSFAGGGGGGGNNDFGDGKGGGGGYFGGGGGGTSAGSSGASAGSGGSGLSGGAGGTGLGVGFAGGFGAGGNGSSGPGGQFGEGAIAAGSTANAGGNVGEAGGATFGPGLGGAAGAGGVVTLTGTTVSVTGTVGAQFPSSLFAGNSINANGPGGKIVIDTIGGTTFSSVYPGDANYGAGAATSTATITGGNFMTAGTSQAPVILFNNFSALAPLAAGTYSGLGITESFVSYLVTNGSLVTPAEYVALVQVATTKSQPLTLTGTGIGTGAASGGSFTIVAANVPGGGFTNLVLPASVTANVSGIGTLAYSGSATISGVLNLQSGSTILTVGTTTAIAATGALNFQDPTGGSLTSIGTISGAGLITALAGTLSVESTTGDIAALGTPLTISGPGVNISLTANSGSITVADITGGKIVINTAPAVVSSVYLSDANYGSGASTYAPGLTGGSLTIAGTIQSSSNQISINGAAQTSPLAAGTYGPFIIITESGNPFTVTNSTMVTPAEYIALVQVTTLASQPLTLTGTGAGTGAASGGNFEIAAANVPVGDFTTLILPSGVTANISAVPTLAYTGAATVDGTINFLTGSTAMTVGTTTSIGAAGTLSFQDASGGSLTSTGTVSGAGLINALAGTLSVSSTTGDIVALSGTPLTISASGVKVNLTANAGQIVVGNITTTGANAGGFGVAGGTGGGVQIDASGLINTGRIQAAGGLGSPGDVAGPGGGNGGTGGDVSVISLTNAVTVGDVDSSGGAGGGGGGPIGVPGASGGAAGKITVFSASSISTGQLLATGGGGGGGSFGGGGAGGAGGDIHVSSSGTTTIGGQANSSGGGGGGAGFTNGGAGGAAGSLKLLALVGSLTVSGPVLAAGGGGGGASSNFGSTAGGGGGSFGGGGGGGAATPAASGGGGLFGGGGGSDIFVPGGGGGSSIQGGPAGPGSALSGTAGLGGNAGGPGGTFGVGGSSPTNAGGNVGQAGTNGQDGNGGAAGAGGAITLTAQTLAINGTVGQLDGGSVGFATSPFAGDSVNAAGAGGTASIRSSTGALAQSNFAGNISAGSTIHLRAAADIGASLLPGGTLSVFAPNISAVATGFVNITNTFSLTGLGTGTVTIVGNPLTTNSSAGTDFILTASNALLLTSSAPLTAQKVTLTTGQPNASILAGANITATGNVVLNSPTAGTNVGATISGASIVIANTHNSDLTISNAGTLTATTGAITASSPAGMNLIVNGGGTLNAVTGGITLTATNAGAASNKVNFTGNQTFNGMTTINAAGANQSVEVQDKTLAQGNNLVLLATPLLTKIGTGNIIGNPLVMVVPSGQAGTIANSTGNIDLATIGNLTFIGQSLAMVAAGSILNSGGAKTINLSTADKKSAGSLTLIAGFNFAPGTAGLVGPVATPFNLNTAATGNISLANVTINTSSTQGSGGNVLAVANGTVTLGAINTSAPLGLGGNVTVIGKGVTTGDITSTGVVFGNVSITSATPQMVTPVTVTNGVISAGSFAPTALAGNIFFGSINAGLGGINIATGGAGMLFRQGLTLSTPGTLSLTTGTSDISLFTFNAGTLQFNTAGNVFAIAPAALNLGTSTVGGSLTLSSSGALTVTGVVTGNKVNLTSGFNNNLNVNANIVGSGTNPVITLTASGAGNITQGGGTIGNGAAGTSAVLQSSSGSFGTAGSRILTDVATLTVSSFGGTANAFITEANGLTTGPASFIGNDLDLRTNGNTVLNGVSAGRHINIDVQTGGTLTQNVGTLLSSTAGGIALATANNAANAITLNGLVSTGGNNASSAITINGGGDITLGFMNSFGASRGDINVTSQNGSINIAPNQSVLASTGNITFTSATGQNLNGFIRTNVSGSISLVSRGSITSRGLSTGALGPLPNNITVNTGNNVPAAASFTLQPGFLLSTGNNGNINITTNSQVNGDIDFTGASIIQNQVGSLTLSTGGPSNITLGLLTQVAEGNINVSVNASGSQVRSQQFGTISTTSLLSGNGNIRLEASAGGSGLVLNGSVRTNLRGKIEVLPSGSGSAQVFSLSTGSLGAAGDNDILIQFGGGGAFALLPNGMLSTGNNGKISISTASRANGTVEIDGSISTFGAANSDINILGARSITINRPIYTASGTVTLTATNGDIITGANAQITAGGAVTMNTSLPGVSPNPAGANITLNSGVQKTGAAGAITIQSRGTLSVGSLSNNNGNISLRATNGSLDVRNSAFLYTPNGDINIQQKGLLATDVIKFGSAVSVYALAPAGSPLGNINVFVDPGAGPPPQQAGVAPANVSQSTSSGGQIFFGANFNPGITANGPSNTLIAKGSNITFFTNAGSAAGSGAITLGGSNFFYADPPGATGPSAVPSLVMPAVAAPGKTVPAMLSPAMGTKLAQGLNPFNLIFSPNANVQPLFAPARGNSDESRALHDQGRLLPSDAASASQNGGGAAATTNVLTGFVAKKTGILGAPATQVRAHSAEFAQPNESTVELSSGEILVSAGKRSHVTAGSVNVEIGSGAIVHVTRSAGLVKVRNLCDSSGKSVNVVIGGKTLPVGIGEELVTGLDSQQVDSALKQDSLGRRKVTKFTAAGGLHLVRSELSIIGLIQKSELLYSMYSKGSAGDKAIMERVLKVAAALFQVTSKRGAYSAYEPGKTPHTVATNSEQSGPIAKSN